MGRKTTLAALMAGIACISLGTATSASAHVSGPGSCTNAMDINRGGTIQCFTWDHNSNTGNYLNVNDWYDSVYSGPYYLSVTWHDLATGKQYIDVIGPNNPDYQPTFNSVLFGVTFIG